MAQPSNRFLSSICINWIIKTYHDIEQVLLDGENGGQRQQSVAVRMALGETQLVAETKQFLVENGIHLEVFDEVQLLVKTILTLNRSFETYFVLGPQAAVEDGYFG